jgi:hypothetical protein
MMFYRLANVSDDLYHTFTTTTALKRSREVIYYFYKILHKQHLCIFCHFVLFQNSKKVCVVQIHYRPTLRIILAFLCISVICTSVLVPIVSMFLT